MSGARPMKVVSIRMSHVDLGSFKASDKSTLIACIGTKISPNTFPHEFPTKSKDFIPHEWTFQYHNQGKATFKMSLWKRHLIGNDVFIGSIDLKLSAFQTNTVVSEVFELHCPNTFMVPPRVRIDVHVNENGSVPFRAPRGMLFVDDFEVVKAKTGGITDFLL